MPGAHAKLSASGSKRWLACPGSVVLEALFPESESPYAEEGTRAHALAELLLYDALGFPPDIDDYYITNASNEMTTYAKSYVDYAMEIYTALKLKHKDAKLFIEESVSFDKYVPKGFGRIDCIILAGKEMHIADLKYGKGVPVDATENPQQRLYALGALQEYGDIYEIQQITTHIVQPRLDYITTESLTRQELEKWGNSIKKLAKTAYNDTRQYKPGEHCKFCKARAYCKQRAVGVLSPIVNILGGN